VTFNKILLKSDNLFQIYSVHYDFQYLVKEVNHAFLHSEQK